jgi:hypothetical protein
MAPVAGRVRSYSAVTRDAWGTASVSSCTYFPETWWPKPDDTPVTLPTGRARLATNPASTGSWPPVAMTMGIVRVDSTGGNVELAYPGDLIL